MYPSYYFNMQICPNMLYKGKEFTNIPNVDGIIEYRLFLAYKSMLTNHLYLMINLMINRGVTSIENMCGNFELKI